MGANWIRLGASMYRWRSGWQPTAKKLLIAEQPIKLAA